MNTFTGFKKGLNLGGWISQCVANTEEHYNNFITEKDIEQIAKWNYDHVRLPIDYEIIMSEDGFFLPSGFRHIDDCISWCKKHGLNIILDLHKTKGYMFDKDAVKDPDLFFHDKALQDVFVKIWCFMAERYGKYSDFVALELLNEIVNPNLQDDWNRIATRAFKEIRQFAPDSWIVVGGVNYNSVSAVPGIDVPYDEKTVFTFHCYEPLVFTHQKAPWVEKMPPDFDVSYPGPSIDYIREKSRLIPQARHGAIFDKDMDDLQLDENFFEYLFKPALDTAEKKNVPLYCGEYGVLDRAPVEDTLRWLNDIHKALENHGIGRALWNYKQKDFGLADSHYDPIREAVVSKN